MQVKDVLKGTAEECSITLKDADQLVKTSGLKKGFREQSNKPEYDESDAMRVE